MPTRHVPVPRQAPVRARPISGKPTVQRSQIWTTTSSQFYHDWRPTEEHSAGSARALQNTKADAVSTPSTTKTNKVCLPIVQMMRKSESQPMCGTQFGSCGC
eukprot:g4486.t1